MRMAKLRLPVFGAGAVLLAGEGAGAVDWSVVALVEEGWTGEFVDGANGSGVCSAGRMRGICES